MVSLALVAIVKNETSVLKRLLDSVKDVIDYWVIEDTGSTDGTPEFIENFFEDHNIPGELFHEPWVNFGHNRTLAVQRAQYKADFLLLFDADFQLIIKNPDFKKNLNPNIDSYLLKYTGGLDYRQLLLVNGKHKWRYVGVTHEYIHSEANKVQIRNDDIIVNHHLDGANRGDKFKRDIALLEQGIKDEPNNARYYFYLARSYDDGGLLDKAIETYSKRVELGGWEEEVYYAGYRKGSCMMRRGDKFEDFCGVLLSAWQTRPKRWEAIYKLVKYCRENSKHHLGYMFGKAVIDKPYPSEDLLFVESNIYNYLLKFEHSICAYYAGHYQEAYDLGQELLSYKGLPENYKGQAEANLKFSIDKLGLK